MEEYVRGIRIGLISIRPVEKAPFFEEVTLNIVELNNFAIGDSDEDGISFCRLILYLQHNTS